MRLEDLRDECPKTPERVRSMILTEVEEQVHGERTEKIVEMTSKKYKRRKMSVAVLAATMLLGTTVFAGVNIYRLQAQKEGNYGLRAGVVVNESQTESASVKVPETIPVLSIEADYLPNGMVKADDGTDKYYYGTTPYEGGVSIGAIAMDEQLSEEKLPLSDAYVVAEEDVSINEHDAIYLEKQNSGGSAIDFDKKIYVAYPEYWQILEIFVGEDVSKGEALQIAKGLKVEATEEMMSLSQISQWSNLLVAEEDDTPMKLTAPKEEMKNLHEVGESFVLPITEVSDNNKLVPVENLQAKVTDVQIADDFTLLNHAFVGEDLKAGLDENGKLIQNQIHYMKTGDGVNTLDEEVHTEAVNQKLVYVTIEYTNTGKETMQDVLFFGSFVGLNEDGDTYTMYDRAAADNDDTTDFVICDSIGKLGEMDYYDVHDGEESKNYISTIEPGETVIVHMAKIVNEDELGSMYLSLDSNGGGFEFTKSMLDTGYVDIRQ